MTTRAASLPPAARAAIVAVITTFEAEGGILPEPAANALTVLATPPAAPEAPTTEPSIAETLLDALKTKVQGKSPPRPVQTAA